MAFIWGQFHQRYLSHYWIKLAWKLNYLPKIKLKSPRGQWVNSSTTTCPVKHCVNKGYHEHHRSSAHIPQWEEIAKSDHLNHLHKHGHTTKFGQLPWMLFDEYHPLHITVNCSEAKNNPEYVIPKPEMHIFRFGDMTICPLDKHGQITKFG